MERASKLFVIVSTGSALAIEATLVARGWPGLRLICAVTFLAACTAGAFADRLAVAAVLACAFIFPAAVLVLHGGYSADFTVLWMIALLGAMAPRAVHSIWAAPVRWRAALVMWALTIAVAWPIVALREVDWLPSLIYEPGLGSSAFGWSPFSAVIWILQTAAGLMLGILWFDWLFAALGSDSERLRRFVLAPILAGATVAAAVGTYQLFGDLLFLNATLFGAMGRASGTLLDGNVFGIVEALASGGVLACWLANERLRWWLAMPLLGLAWLGIWASGSRTALVAAVVPVVFAGWHLIRPSSSGAPRPPRLAVAIVASIVVAAVVAAATMDLPAIGPVRRLRESLPAASLSSVEAFLHEMWSRNGYGSAAALMIREHPLVGVGVGAYHVIVPDYSRSIGFDYVLPPDNAQNWFRHQLAEFGLIGSAGWIAWVVLFGLFFLRAPVSPLRRATAGILKATLAGVVLISLVGMPTQDVTVAIAFWALAFWLVQVAGYDQATADRRSIGRRTWAVMAVVVALFAAGTVYAGRHDLRPPQRALAFGWPYSYGFANTEPGADGLAYRWAAKQAVAVVPATGPWLRLRVSVNHRDLNRRPVHAKVWCDGALVLDVMLRNSVPVTRSVRVPPGPPRVLIETLVDRVVHPRDFGIPDDRDLGLFVHWDFGDRPDLDGPPTVTRE
jgi:hypothetical protein